MTPQCPNCGTDLPGNPRECPICGYDQDLVRDLVRTKEERETLVGLPPKDTLERAAEYLTSNGATITNRTENSISFTYHKGPDPIIFIILFLLAVIPGILYAIFAKRDVNFMVTAKPAPGGCSLHFGGEFGAGYDGYRHWLRTLPKPGSGRLRKRQAAGKRQAAEETHIDLPTQIQKLAELRDAGIVTEEEFEAKKRDLLDRM